MQSRVARPAKYAGQPVQKSDVNLKQWPGPSNTTIFVRCLRLLDLDRLADWPGITENVFASKAAQQNLQARIKAVEWSLYRLFEIYDPKEAQAKLRPFFPPLAPLQSLNLRAALYRALTELKKSGALGRDVVLRKTMLDECKGEKFEEVISALALVVLRKACTSRYPDLDLGQIEQTPAELLVPLILTYRQSLQQNLLHRQSILQHAQEYHTKLELVQIDMQTRIGEAHKGFHTVNENDLKHFSDVVRRAWVGDDRLADVLLEGKTHSASPFVQVSFQSGWPETLADKSLPDPQQKNFAAELEARVEEQKNRLKKWTTFNASMKNTQRGGLQPSKSLEAAQTPQFFGFDQHKELRFDSVPAQQTATAHLQPYHASVLKNMREELAALSASSPTTKTSAAKRYESHSAASQLEAVEDTPFSFATTKTTEVEKQSIIPSSTQDEILASSAVWCELTPNIDMNDGIQEGNKDAVAPADAGDPEISPGIKESFQDDESMGIPSSPPIGDGAVDETPPFLENGLNEIADRMPQSERKSLPTLHERTRASLLPFLLRLSYPNVHDDPTPDDEGHTSQLLPSLPEIVAPRGTLLERTRQSMSLLPNPPSQSKGSRQSSVKPSRFSEVFPINQFETPGKGQAQHSGAWSPRSGSSTPRDKLFSEEADYASVFKSRPRIAVSPSLSPERSSVGLESLSENGVSELELGVNIDTPSRSPVRQA